MHPTKALLMNKLFLLPFFLLLYSSFSYSQKSDDPVIEADVQAFRTYTAQDSFSVADARAMANDINTRYELSCAQKGRVFSRLGWSIFKSNAEEYYPDAIHFLKDSSLYVWSECADVVGASRIFNPSYMLLYLYEYTDQVYEAKQVLDYIDAHPDLLEGKPDHLKSDVYALMATLRAESGDHLAAQPYFNKAYALFDSVGYDRKFEYLSRYGSYLNDSKRFDESINTYQKAFEYTTSAQDSLQLILNYMSPLLSTNQLSTIGTFIPNMQFLIENSEFDHHRSYAYYQLTKYHIQSGNLDGAKSTLDKLHAMYSKDPENTTLAANLYSVAGHYHSTKNNTAEAVHMFEKAIYNQVIGTKPNIYNTESALSDNIIKDYETLVINLQELIQIYIKDYKLNGNLEQLDMSLSLVTQLDGIFQNNRSEFLSEFSKITQIGSSYSVFEDAIAVCHQQYEQTKDKKYLEQAFTWSAQNKSSVLNSMRSTNALYASSISNEDFEHLMDLESKKRTVESKLISAGGKDEELSTAYLELRSEQRKALNSLEKKYPNLKTKAQDANVLTIDHIVNKGINNESALIDIFYGRSHVFLFFISNTNSIFLKEAIRPEDVSLMQNVTNDLYSYANLETLNKNSEEVFKRYFKEALDSYKSSGIKNLIVVPDGEFHNIPLEVLWDGEDYLINSFNTSYLYSYDQLRTGAQLHSKDYIGFGSGYGDKLNEKLNSYFTEAASALGSADTIDILLTNLGSSSKEIQLANEEYQGQVFLDAQSTKKNFIEKAPHVSGIIHMALHGLVLNENTSCIIFDDRSEDIILNSNEVYAMELKNELSILSACYSATGKIYKGEGVRNLARSFLYAGTKSIVPSLWTSSDISNTTLVGGFLKNMKAGNSPSIALTKSKRDYLAQASPANKHPGYWGNMIFVGNPVQHSSLAESIKLFLVLAFALAFLIYLFKRKQN